MSDKIWFKSYAPNTPEEINPAAYSSLVDLFEQVCVRFKNLPAVTNFGTSLTYAELDELSRDFAAYLQQELGLVKGDRFAIMLPNVLQYYVAMFGALRAGLAVVNINPLYTAAEIITEVTDAKVEHMIVLANFAHTVEKAWPSMAMKRVIVTDIGDLFPFPKSLLFNVVTRFVKKGVPTYHVPESVSFKKALAQGKNYSFSREVLTSEDIAFLQYTGGTTGVPKGAVLTHGNIVANVEQALAWIKSSGLEEGKEVIIAPLPLYHIFSLTVCAFCFLNLGGNAVLITNPRDIIGFIKELAKTPFTVLVGINTLFNAMNQRPEITKLSFAHVKLVITGGMGLQQAVAETWHMLTGNWILQGYGLTEASPIVTINPTNISGFNGSIGLPLPSTDVKILDEQGQEVPLGEEGELCVKGPQVMRGYWNNDQETRAVFTADGWLRTGDMAKLDEKGFVYLIDRKKDMIIVSGFKVYPNEVENVIVTHPGVREAAVVGVINGASGEVVKAFVVRKDPHLTAEEVIAFCRESLTRYKVPHLVEFVDELPKSYVGKILRRELKKN